jgi:putative thiamine transport system ATP-binding protein
MRGLRLDAVDIRLDAAPLIALDTTVAPGEVLAIMGPSGVGKSTLLGHVAGFLDPAFTATGRILIDGVDITGLAPERRRIGLLFQDPMLFPHLSVAGNLLFGLKPGNTKTGHASARRLAVGQALAETGLSGFEGRDVATLSGGQKARVALLRSLLAEPAAMLLDEPFSRLDRAMRIEVRALVLDRLRTAGLPVILVTHDESDAEAADRVIRL